jgi:penicillin-binding protein 1A
MANGNTGGQIAAPIWHDFMAVAHKDMNIPTLPGLDPHPAQVAEQQRIAQLRITDPALAAQLTGEAEAQAKASRRLPDAARDALRQMASDLRKAAGLAAKPAGGSGGAPAQPAPSGKPGDRAALPNSSPGRSAGTDTRSSGVVQ